MGIAKIAYKIKGNITEQQAASILTTRFTGQLKYWWDNPFTLQDKAAILDHTIEVEDEQGVTRKSDADDYLMVTIGMHFIGNPKEALASAKIFLTNIRCPTLSDFRWYKDMFLTYV